MASLRRLPNSKYWIACFTDKDGKQRQRSTKIEAKGSKNKARAQRVAEGYEQAARQSRTSRQIQRVCWDLMKDIAGAEPTAYTAKEWFTHWLSTQKAVTSARAMERYQGQAERFLAFLGERSAVPVDEISKQDVQAFRDARLGRVALKTAKHEIDFLRRVFGTAVTDGVLVESPADGVTLPKLTDARQTKRRPFKLDELRAVMAHADQEWRSLIVFGLYTGQRLGDVALLTWNNIDTEKGVVRLKTQKTGAELEIPIATPLANHIASLPTPDGPDAPIHPHAFAVATRHGKVAALSAEFRRILESAGLVPRKNHKKAVHGQGRDGRRSVSEISYHSLRHLATSAMKNAGANSDVVMKVVGHESADISRGYTHAELAAMREAANSIPDILTEA